MDSADWDKMTPEQRELWLLYMTKPPNMYPTGMRQEKYRGRYVRLGERVGSSYRRWIPINPDEMMLVYKWLTDTKSDTSGMFHGAETGLPYVRDDVWQDFLVASVLS